MDDLEQRVKALETKVKILEETFETLKNMQLSEQMEGFIQSRTKTLKFVDLVNSVSGKTEIDFRKEAESVRNIRIAKQNIDRQIANALRNSTDFSNQTPSDPHFFNYETESGLTIGLLDDEKKDPELGRWIGKGLRITSYNGFDTDKIIVPSEIDGNQVISIGIKAFMNSTASEIILPNTIKAIAGKAFTGCSNLKHLDLPEGIEYLGESCFSQSGLETVSIPGTIRKLSSWCFDDCTNLHSVSIGEGVVTMEYGAFGGCASLKQIALPETLRKIGKSFYDTALSVMIIPSEVESISHEAFKANHSRGNRRNVTCVFLGKETTIEKSSHWDSFANVSLIYCLPGSKAQAFAREHSITMKPLSEFRLEEHT